MDKVKLYRVVSIVLLYFDYLFLTTSFIISVHVDPWPFDFYFALPDDTLINLTFVFMLVSLFLSIFLYFFDRYRCRNYGCSKDCKYKRLMLDNCSNDDCGNCDPKQ